MKKRVCSIIPMELFETLRQYARAQRRTISGQVCHILTQFFEQQAH